MQKLETRDHGNAWSIYFSDPEGNRMEVYMPSPWYVAQPFGEPLDLTQPAEAIHAKTEAMVQAGSELAPDGGVVRRHAQEAGAAARRRLTRIGSRAEIGRCHGGNDVH